MTRRDRLLNPATLACLFPCLLELCPEIDKKLLGRFNRRRPTPSQHRLMHTFQAFVVQRPLSSETTPAIDAIENP